MPSVGKFWILKLLTVMLLRLIRSPLPPADTTEPSITTPAPVPSIVSPAPVKAGSCVTSEITPGGLGGGGKTAGSKVMTVATPSELAAPIAALKLPAPESAVLVTTMAHEGAAPMTNEIANAKPMRADCFESRFDMIDSLPLVKYSAQPLQEADLALHGK